MAEFRSFTVYENLTVAANGQRRFDVAGAFFNVIACDQDDFKIGFEDRQRFTVETGFKARLEIGESFRYLVLENPNGSTLTVTIAIGFGDFSDEGVVISGSVDVTAPATLTDYADDSVAATTTEVILAASATRKEAVIHNLAANTATFRIGTTNAGAARGIPLAPGQTLILRTSAAIYAYNPSGGAESLAKLEILT